MYEHIVDNLTLEDGQAIWLANEFKDYSFSVSKMVEDAQAHTLPVFAIESIIGDKIIAAFGFTTLEQLRDYITEAIEEQKQMADEIEAEWHDLSV